MKLTRIFTRMNLTLLTLAALLTGALLFAGCASESSGGSEHSSHGSSCH